MKTERTRLRRSPERGHFDRETINAILDASPLCHIGYQDSFGTPAVMPNMGWREGDHYYWHASNGARSLKAMKEKDVCVTVTLMDGFVMARSAMHHSINFRSVMLYGKTFVVDASHKEEKLKNMIEHMYPGRWEQLRPINEIELKQTAVFGIEISEGAAKIRTGGVGDDEADMDYPCWSGVVPISYKVGAPIDDALNQTGTPIGDDISKIKLG